MLNNLELTIQKIITDAASSMAKEVAAAIRQGLAADIIGHGVATFPAPKRLGRPPGSGKKVAAAVAAPAAAPAAPAKRGTRKSYKRRLIKQSELEAVLAVMAKKPGLTSVEIQQEAGIDQKQAERVLGKLRKTGKVSLKGKRSAATYTVA